MVALVIALLPDFMCRIPELHCKNGNGIKQDSVVAIICATYGICMMQFIAIPLNEQLTIRFNKIC